MTAFLAEQEGKGSAGAAQHHCSHTPHIALHARQLPAPKTCGFFQKCLLFLCLPKWGKSRCFSRGEKFLLPPAAMLAEPHGAGDAAGQRRRQATALLEITINISSPCSLTPPLKHVLINLIANSLVFLPRRVCQGEIMRQPEDK